MDTQPNYRIVTISGKVGVGKSSLRKKLETILGWKYVSAGDIQREFDRQHGRNENQVGAMQRSDDHEREIEAMTKKYLLNEKDVIYEAWLAGFVAQGIPGVLKVLVICSNDAIRIDRVVNRDKVTVEQAKQMMKQRETENVEKWKQLYGNHDFWDPKMFDIVIDTYESGPMETAGIVLDKLGVDVSKAVTPKK